MRYEQRLIWVLGITFGFLFFDRNAASFLMPFIARDLNFTNQQVGLIASALSFTWAVSAFLGGALSDHTGRRKAVLLTRDRKSTRLNSSHGYISYAVFCLKKK